MVVLGRRGGRRAGDREHRHAASKIHQRIQHKVIDDSRSSNDNRAKSHHHDHEATIDDYHHGPSNNGPADHFASHDRTATTSSNHGTTCSCRGSRSQLHAAHRWRQLLRAG